MPSSYRAPSIGYYSTSYGTRNPCPDGQYINTLIAETTFADQTVRNITYLICDTNNPNEPSLSLILGLSLGLGIPALIIVIVFIIKCFYCDGRRRVDDRLLQNLVAPAPTVFDILTPESQRLFSLGILDDNFRNELSNMPKDKLFICRDEALKNNKHNIATYISVLLDSLVHVHTV